MKILIKENVLDDIKKMRDIIDEWEELVRLAASSDGSDSNKLKRRLKNANKALIELQDRVYWVLKTKIG